MSNLPLDPGPNKQRPKTWMWHSILKGDIYLRDYFLTGTAAASRGCQVIDREQNECNALSDTDTHLRYCDGYQAQEQFWNLYQPLFLPHTTANERKYVFVSLMTLTRREDTGRERVNLDDWHSSVPLCVGPQAVWRYRTSLCWLLACLQNHPTLVDHPDPTHNETTANSDRNNRKPPTKFRE